MDKKIKAIETVYNGYKFRSRLEARWAVFFDELGVRYTYEQEGYDLHYNGPYLPDFALFDKEKKYLVEIKPMPEPHHEPAKPELLDKDATRKAIELSMMVGGTVILIFGDPLEHVSFWYWNGLLDLTGGSVGFDGSEVHVCMRHGFKPSPDWPEMEFMYKEQAMVARQARFEHGEAR
jgi:hypothetical protein